MCKLVAGLSTKMCKLFLGRVTMKTIFIISTFVLGLTVAYGQTEPLNQLTSDGKKDGKWILYLDSKGDKVKDSTTAVYWRYTYYDHGIHIYPMGGFTGKKGEIGSPDNKQAGKIKMLDGEYKCYENGKLKFIHTFKEGEYISYKEYFSSGQLCTYFDYTKHFDGQPHSWYMYTYDKTGKATYEGWVKKDEQGNWPKMRG